MARAIRVADLLWRFAAIASLSLIFAIALGWFGGLRLIMTSSVPKGLWWVHHGDVARGRYVLTCLPANIASIGKRAGYLSPGFCAEQSMPVMKRVVALKGDVVVVSEQGVAVNGVALPSSKRLTHDSRGEPIPGLISFATYRVGDDAVWLLGDWFKSWDSRYYGSASLVRVIGIGTPLFVTPPGS